MKRSLAFIIVALLIASVSFVSAEEAVVLDFNLLAKGDDGQNEATKVDFAVGADSSYTEEQLEGMATSLAVENWDVILSSSARTNERQALCLTKEASVREGAKKFGGETVLGVRVNFPTESYNAWAQVKVPFEIPAFEPKAEGEAQSDDPTNAKMTKFEGTFNADTQTKTAYGIVKNVGVIKSVSVTVKGLNFPHALYVVFKDNNNNDKRIFMGYLNFDGWRELRWDNPQYISDIRNRELRVDPLYPVSTPMLKFDSFIITRDANAIGGDFIAYFKDVKVVYDKAVLDDTSDIDDESVWNIVATKEDARKKAESARFGAKQALRYLESQKKHPDSASESTATTETEGETPAAE